MPGQKKFYDALFAAMGAQPGVRTPEETLPGSGLPLGGGGNVEISADPERSQATMEAQGSTLRL